VNLQKMPVDYIAITGHKGLLGPTGTGALYCKDPEKMTPLIQGGTGSKSDSFAMPDEMPDMLEAGTPNIAGIFGLNGALCTETKPGHSREQFRQLLLELRKLPRLELYTATDFNNQGPVFSLRHKNHDSSTLGLYLQENFGLETRIGLHCAPLAHQSLKTFPGGTVRFSLSVFHRQIELEYLRNALTEADKL
jgi:selenocysteine lyase/cysteine desulfurase